ncbi:MAG: hypothetical protein ACYS8L_04935 [Planctomycetota bacterium]|jgi:hypothetical protein
MRWKAIRLAAVALVVVSLPLARAQVMQWSGNFGAINLPSITTQSSVVTGNSTAELETTGNCELTADNSATAQLSGPGGDVLVTEYSLTFDGDGASATGAATVDYTTYSSFLSPAVAITHVGGDDYVQVTLHVRAQNFAGDVANAGAYSATQTITASWVGP